MLNEYTSRNLATQHRDELLREAERDRLAQSVTANDEKGTAVRSAGALPMSLFARIRHTLCVRSTSPVADASM